MCLYFLVEIESDSDFVDDELSFVGYDFKDVCMDDVVLVNELFQFYEGFIFEFRDFCFWNLKVGESDIGVIDFVFEYS